MTTEQEVRDRIREYIVRELLHGDARDFDAKSPLLEWGVLESFSMVALLEFIEREFSAKVGHDNISPENFENLDAITGMVMNHLR